MTPSLSWLLVPVPNQFVIAAFLMIPSKVLGNVSEAERNWSTLAVQFEPRLSLLYEILDRSSPSRVRFAAQQQRALDCCGPFQETPSFQEGKAQNGKGPVRRQSGPIFHCHRQQSVQHDSEPHHALDCPPRVRRFPT